MFMWKLFEKKLLNIFKFLGHILLSIFMIINDKMLYILWFGFYYWLYVWFFRLIGLRETSTTIVFLLFGVSLVLAFLGAGENLWRNLTGIRPLRLRKEKERLLPLFKEVYMGAVKANENLSRGIRLYIKEDMSINAYAFGTETLVLTKGSINLLSDECLKGLIAHEFGHFSNLDTVASLFMSIGNFYYSFFIAILERTKASFEKSGRALIIKFIFDIIYWIFKGIQNLSNLLFMNSSRKQEYKADVFALNSGFGNELATALIEIYEVSFTKPLSIKEMLNNSHPPITKRIEKLEMSCHD